MLRSVVCFLKAVIFTPLLKSREATADKPSGEGKILVMENCGTAFISFKPQRRLQSSFTECLLPSLECPVKCQKCLVSSQKCLIECYKCLVSSKECLVECQKCLVSSQECLFKWNKCLESSWKCLVRGGQPFHIERPH